MVKGIVRKIDQLGRITIPIEYRKTIDLKAGNKVGLQLEGKTIHIVKQDNFIGMTRPLDELGRIAIPIEIRRELGFTERQKVDLYIKEEEICIQKKSNACAICGRTGELFKLEKIKEVHICNSCIQNLLKTMERTY